MGDSGGMSLTKFQKRYQGMKFSAGGHAPDPPRCCMVVVVGPPNLKYLLLAMGRDHRTHISLCYSYILVEEMQGWSFVYLPSLLILFLPCFYTSSL